MASLLRNAFSLKRAGSAGPEETKEEKEEKEDDLVGDSTEVRAAYRERTRRVREACACSREQRASTRACLHTQVYINVSRLAETPPAVPTNVVDGHGAGPVVEVRVLLCHHLSHSPNRSLACNLLFESSGVIALPTRRRDTKTTVLRASFDAHISCVRVWVSLFGALTHDDCGR